MVAKKKAKKKKIAKKKFASIKKIKFKKKKKKKKGGNPTGKGGFGDHPELINRNGAPPKEKTLTFQLRRMLEETNTEDIHVTHDGRFVFEKDDGEGNKHKKLDLLNKEIVIKSMMRSAMKGNTGMMQQLYDRMEGKIPQEVKMLGNDLDNLTEDEIERRLEELKSRIAST